jgi:hypothetical protein
LWCRSGAVVGRGSSVVGRRSSVVGRRSSVVGRRSSVVGLTMLNEYAGMFIRHSGDQGG